MTMGRVAYRAPQSTLAQRRAASERFLEVMRGRRSIRDFSARPVPRELVVNAIEAAALAPRGANQQPWIFVLIGDDPDLRARIRAAAEAEEREGVRARQSTSPSELARPDNRGRRSVAPGLSSNLNDTAVEGSAAANTRKCQHTAAD